MRMNMAFQAIKPISVSRQLGSFLSFQWVGKTMLMNNFWNRTPTCISSPPRLDDGHQVYESPWACDIAYVELHLYDNMKSSLVHSYRAGTAFHNADTARVTPLYGTQRELDA